MKVLAMTYRYRTLFTSCSLPYPRNNLHLLLCLPAILLPYNPRGCMS